MNQPISERVRWTTADLELFPDNGNRYEIIDRELFVTRAPHWNHQKTCVRISTFLDNWSTNNVSDYADFQELQLENWFY